jgi:hypothetical protein
VKSQFGNNKKCAKVSDPPRLGHMQEDVNQVPLPSPHLQQAHQRPTLINRNPFFPLFHHSFFGENSPTTKNIKAHRKNRSKKTFKLTYRIFVEVSVVFCGPNLHHFQSQNHVIVFELHKPGCRVRGGDARASSTNAKWGMPPMLRIHMVFGGRLFGRTVSLMAVLHVRLYVCGQVGRPLRLRCLLRRCHVPRTSRI